MRRIALALDWFLGWAPLPECIEFPLSEWCYRRLHTKPTLPAHPWKFGPQQIERE